jgi:hypothetical protein
MRLISDIGYHRNLAKFYNELYNKHFPIKDGRPDVDAAPLICAFYERMCIHHTIMGYQFAEHLEEYRELNPGLRGFDLTLRGGQPPKSAGCP